MYSYLKESTSVGNVCHIAAAASPPTPNAPCETAVVAIWHHRRVTSTAAHQYRYRGDPQLPLEARSAAFRCLTVFGAHVGLRQPPTPHAASHCEFQGPQGKYHESSAVAAEWALEDPLTVQAGATWTDTTWAEFVVSVCCPLIGYSLAAYKLLLQLPVTFIQYFPYRYVQCMFVYTHIHFPSPFVLCRVTEIHSLSKKQRVQGRK